MLRQDDWNKAQLVTFGWLYGKRYGGHLASCLIMDVIMNRVRAGWGNVANVIYDFPKTAANSVLEYEVPHIWEPNFVRLLHEVESSYDGSKDSSKGALYFCDTALPISEWFKDHILDEKEIHSCIGNMNSLQLYR